MKSFLPLLSLALVFASCSSAYKSGQTPDDVYFSPERPQQEYVRADQEDDDKYYRGEQNRSSDYYNYEEDRYLRMKVRNRNRWVYIDNDFYSYNPYVYNSSYYYNSPWNSYSYWDHCYNPYSRQVIVYNPKTAIYNRPRTINLRTFDNPQNNTSNTKGYNPRSSSNSGNRNNSYSAPRRNIGNDLRNIFDGSSSNNNSGSSSGSSSSRVSTPSSNSSSSGSSSSSSSSGSSSNAPSRRF
jgi:uncharacterized membrane protein YgcG